MTTTNQIIASLSGNLIGDANGNVITTNVGNYVGNTLSLIANNGSQIRQVTVQSSTDANFTANYTLTLPIGVSTTNNLQVLGTDSNGVLSWSSTMANGNSNISVAASNGNITMRVTGSNAFLLAPNTVAIGNSAGAGNIGANTVYIGALAAQNGNSLSNVIVLNATGAALNPRSANATYIRPIRFEGNIPTNISNNKVLTFDTNSSEIRYGSPVFDYAIENINVVAAAPGGVVNLDLLATPFSYYTTNATANFTIAVRGNATTFVNQCLNSNQSATVSILIRNASANSFGINSLLIDAISQTVFYNGGFTTVAPNAISAYTFTIIKTASQTYTVLGAVTSYS